MWKKMFRQKISAVSYLRTCRPSPPQKCPLSEIFFLFFQKKKIQKNWFFQKNDTKMTITRKIKIGKIWKLVLFSLQLNANILRKKNSQKKKKKNFFFKKKKSNLFKNRIIEMSKIQKRDTFFFFANFFYSDFGENFTVIFSKIPNIFWNF